MDGWMDGWKNERKKYFDEEKFDKLNTNKTYFNLCPNILEGVHTVLKGNSQIFSPVKGLSHAIVWVSEVPHPHP